jgi:hypothetical protein
MPVLARLLRRLRDRERGVAAPPDAGPRPAEPAEVIVVEMK